MARQKKSTGKKYVSYLRVSTQEQGKSGLGLDAQREAIKNKVEQTGGEIVAEFAEVASGKNNKRPKLAKAIALCAECGYTLIVAKLDRLGRNASYLFEIRDNIKDLVIVDMPDMDTIKFGVFATFAQYERERISARTKEGLEARERTTGQRNGQKPGCNMDNAHIAAAAARKENAMENQSNIMARNIVEMELEKGTSYRKIAEIINRIGLKTPTGKLFSVASVQKVIEMYGLKKRDAK